MFLKIFFELIYGHCNKNYQRWKIGLQQDMKHLQLTISIANIKKMNAKGSV